jgi:hypothetical protein
MGLRVDHPHPGSSDRDVVDVRSGPSSIGIPHRTVVQCGDVLALKLLKLRRDGTFTARALRPDPRAGRLVEQR